MTKEYASRKLGHPTLQERRLALDLMKPKRICEHWIQFPGCPVHLCCSQRQLAFVKVRIGYLPALATNREDAETKARYKIMGSSQPNQTRSADLLREGDNRHTKGLLPSETILWHVPRSNQTRMLYAPSWKLWQN